jgi:hypothetical protein
VDDMNLLADDPLPDGGRLLTYRLRDEEIKDNRLRNYESIAKGELEADDSDPEWETRVFGGQFHGDGWLHDSAEAALEYHREHLAERWGQ